MVNTTVKGHIFQWAVTTLAQRNVSCGGVSQSVAFRKDGFPLCLELGHIICCSFCLWIGSVRMYMFPVAAVTYYHKLRGLKQHKYILWQSWRSEAEIRFARVKSRWRQGGLFVEAERTIWFLVVFSLSWLPVVFGLWPLPVFKSHYSSLSFCHPITFSSLISCLPLTGSPVITPAPSG